MCRTKVLLKFQDLKIQRNKAPCKMSAQVFSPSKIQRNVQNKSLAQIPRPKNTAQQGSLVFFPKQDTAMCRNNK